jgi:hypothetical protein
MRGAALLGFGTNPLFNNGLPGSAATTPVTTTKSSPASAFDMRGAALLGFGTNPLFNNGLPGSAAAVPAATVAAAAATVVAAKKVSDAAIKLAPLPKVGLTDYSNAQTLSASMQAVVKGITVPLAGGVPAGSVMGPDGTPTPLPEILPSTLKAIQSSGQSLSARRKEVLGQAAVLGATYLSSDIFTNTGVRGPDGKPSNYATEGAQAGAMVGGIVGGIVPVIGPVLGGVLGSALGGFIGGREKKPQTPITPEYAALAKIEQNTREAVTAITNQTRSILSPENRLLYAPSTFQIPGARPFDSGSSAAVAAGDTHVGGVVININGADKSGADLADEIAARLGTQLSNLGTYTDSRY